MASEESDELTDDEKQFESLTTVDRDEEMRILSNYLTLRQSEKWDKKSISMLIDNAASIKELPKNYMSDKAKAIIYKKRRVLELDKQNLSKTTSDDARKSCQSIIDFVTENNKKGMDPLLKDYDEYRKEKINNPNEDIKMNQINSDDEYIAGIKEEDPMVKECATIIIKMNTSPEIAPGEDHVSSRVKKFVKLSNEVRSRIFGFLDLITDLILLLSSAQSPQLLVLTITLLLSICSPYIISYSSGVQLHLLTRSFKDLKGTKHLMLVLFLLPSGILYYIFLDFMDVFSTLARWINFTIFRLEWEEVEKYEMSVSKIFGMDIMRWEGFKRQKKIGQLVFESIPQTVIQIIIYYFLFDTIFGDGSDETSISNQQLAISIFFAASNSIFAIMKLVLEAKCANCNFLRYALQCVKARNGWVPDMDKLEDRNGFMLQYKIDFKCKTYTHRLSYQFGTDTIRILMGQLRTMNRRDNNEQNVLNFGDTLRFLPLQDIIDLYEICAAKNIAIKSDVDMSDQQKHRKDPWLNALKMSRKDRRDPRVLEHARDHNGVPYIMKLMKLSKSKALNGREILKFLIDEGFDLNLHDVKTNESVIHLLIRSFDYKNLQYIFQNYSKAKGVIIRLDYHSKNGISPLGVALELYDTEVKAVDKVKKTIRNANDFGRDITCPILWELLVDYGAKLSFPCKIDSAKVETSPLFFVLRDLKNENLARKLMEAGARIYSIEMCDLNALFVSNKMNKLLCDVVKHCGRTIESLADQSGNNPLHHYINHYRGTEEEQDQTVDTLTSLISICDEWRNLANDDGYCPFELILLKRNSHLFFSYFECDRTFKKSILKNKECVQQLIDWILSVMEKIVRKYPNGISREQAAKDSKDKNVMLLTKMFQLKRMGRSIRWPSQKYCPPKTKGKPISLIGTALDKKLMKAANYLIKTWRITAKKMYKEKMKELEEDKEKRKLAESLLGSSSFGSNGSSGVRFSEVVVKKPVVHKRRSAYSSGYTIRDKPTLRMAKLRKVKSAFLEKKSDVHKIDMLHNLHFEVTFRFEKVCSFAVEVLSAADYITDVIVLLQLIDNDDSWWASFMILFMMSPYLIAHSTMISLVDTRLNSLRSKTTIQCGSCDRCRLVGTKILVWILLTPIAVIWFALFDVIFIFHLFISAIFLVLTFAQCDITDILEDLFFGKLLNMSRIQIIGYRRLRSLSQLLFETLPQIVLQAYILYKFRAGATNIEVVNEFEIQLSIFIAFVHMFFEMSIIYLDAKASKISLSQYILICLGGRINWVPFMQNIERDIKDLQMIESKEQTKTVYDFENIAYKPLCFFGKEYRMEYEFTKTALQQLTTFFDSLPYPKSNLAPNNPLLEPLWLSYNQNESLSQVVIGRISCRSLDFLSVAEFIRSTNNKILLDTKNMNWNDVLENVTQQNDDILQSLVSSFTDYKLLSQLSMSWNFDAIDIKRKIIASSASDILPILKRYSDEGIQCGVDGDIACRLYKMIDDNEWIKSWAAIDSSYAFVILLALWYTRRTIFHHQDANGAVKFVDDPNRANFLMEVADFVLPKKFIVCQKSKVAYAPTEEEQAMNERINESNFNPNMKLSVQFSQEEDGKYDDPNVVKVDFQIAECFDYFHEGIEMWLINSLAGGHVMKKFIPRLQVDENSLFDSFQQKMTEQHIDFIKLIINSSWRSIQQFPVHDLFPALFDKLDKPIVRFGMVHGFGKYLLASKQFRKSQTLSTEIGEFNCTKSKIWNIEFNGLHEAEIEEEHKNIKNEGVTATTMELEAGRHIELSDQLLINQNQKNVVEKKVIADEILGIGEIELEFEDFEFKQFDEEIDANSSSGKIQILTILPQKTLIDEDDELMLNKVVLKEVSFEDIVRNGKMAIDLYDNEILGMFRPIYNIQNGEIALMPLKILIKPSRNGIEVACKGIKVKATFLTNEIIKIMDFDQNLNKENVLNVAINLNMKELVTFVSKHQRLFDDNALDDRLQNALHILCSQSDPDMDMFNAVLNLKEIDINQARLDGQTPHQVLTNNLRVSVDKKSEMLRRITSHKQFKADVHFKKVLVVGCENSGRRSLMTHLRIQHEKRKYSDWEISTQKSKIHKFISSTMEKLIDECDDEKIKDGEDAKRFQKIAIQSDHRYMQRMDKNALRILENLWLLKPIQGAASKMNNASSIFYCFDERLSEIMQKDYVPNEQDLIRLLDDSVSVVTSVDEGTQCNITWIGQSSAEKVFKSSPLYDHVECVIFMVSLTAFMEEMNVEIAEQNALLESLSLFKQYCNDKRFDGSKFVILFNKTDIFEKMVADKDKRLQQIIINNEQIIDTSDYRQWLSLIQSMFRAQNEERVIFSYPITLADPTTVRPVIKEIEDIVMEPNIPKKIDMTLGKEKLLKGVQWIATVSGSDVKLRKVFTEEIEKIDNNFPIDLNCMLFPDGDKIPNYLIKDEFDNDVWAKWCKEKKKDSPASCGYWQIIKDEEDLNAIFGVLQHKVLRIRFDGNTMNQNPIKINIVNGEEYHISWWNMARIGHCNALIINNSYYLNAAKVGKINNRNLIEWSWYNNDSGDLVEYDPSVVDQLECSYQANLSNNFPDSIIKQEKDIFNHCILNDLMQYCQQNYQNSSTFTLHFEKKDMKLCSATQYSIKRRNDKFGRPIQRRVNERNVFSDL